MTTKKNILALRQKKAIIEKGGGDKAIQKQTAMGKLTAANVFLFYWTQVRFTNMIFL